MYYKDDFNVTFEEESAFYKYLDDVEKRAEWFRAQSKDLTVEAVTKDSTCTPIGNINLEYLKEDTINNSGLLIKTPDRSCFLGISAIKSLKGRARIDGKALAELDKETLAYILNKCLKVSRGKSLLRFCEGKVRAVLSGDEKDYSILSMPEVYEIAGAYIYSDFEYASFKSGCADHNLVNATWELRDRRLTEAYKELLERYGKTFNGELYASVRITTSDVGSSGANIFYTVSVQNQYIVLGENLKVRHKNCKGTEDFNQNMSDCTAYPALTIHKAIGLKGEAGEEEWDEESMLEASLIIVDECSMIDMPLMDKFLSRVPIGTRLVFLGDKDQLESVGPGNVFKEMIESGVIPVTILTESFRQEGKSTIIQNADKINERKTNLFFDDTFQFYPAKDDEEAAEIIQKLYREELQKNENRVEGVQVLSPLRKDTKVGADALNPVLRDIVNPKRYGYPEIKNGSTTYRERDLVMQLKNEEDVANGDVGEVLNIYKADGKSRMRVDFGDGKIMEYTEGDIWPLNLAYCITVHKAQGSEYPVVILPMLTCFYRMLRKNLFYTAVTRARRGVKIVGSKKAMVIAINNDTVSKRNTMFGYRIKKIYKAYLEQEKKSA